MDLRWRGGSPAQAMQIELRQQCRGDLCNPRCDRELGAEIRRGAEGLRQQIRMSGRLPAAPEHLPGPGGIAAIAVIVSIGLVLYNRSKNR